jgi:hypothetical protein
MHVASVYGVADALSGQHVPAGRVLVIPGCVPVCVVRGAARAVCLTHPLACDDTSIFMRYQWDSDGAGFGVECG